jgi:lipopolysaccharide transport system ATP-binding protein
VRLAFSVAAHLEPEVLIIDEVLAVGDAEFQRKCLGKMESSANQDGKTVLFVSHQLDAVKKLCPQSILLINGTIESYSSSHDVISQYMNYGGIISSGEAYFQYKEDEIKRLQNYPIHVRVLDSNYRVSSHHLSCNPIFVETSYVIKNAVNNPKLNLHIHAEDGTPIFATIDNSVAIKSPGEFTSTLEIPGNLLNLGMYFVSVYISSFSPTKIYFARDSMINFTILNGFPEHLSQGFDGKMPGFFAPLLIWKSEFKNKRD